MIHRHSPLPAVQIFSTMPRPIKPASHVPYPEPTRLPQKPLPRLLAPHLLEQRQIQGHLLAHPRRPLRMIPLLHVRVRMDECAQRATVDDEPGDKGAKLLRREEVDFERGDRVRADGALADLVDAEFGD